MSARSFHLGDILSLTTGRLVSPRHMDGVHDLCSFMAGEPVWTHQLPRVARECEPALLAQHPDLADIEVPDFPAGSGAAGAVDRWLSDQVARFGEWREVLPLKPDDHTSIDSLAELAMNHPGTKVIAVALPDEEGPR
jgi:hypothetical protein